MQTAIRNSYRTTSLGDGKLRWRDQTSKVKNYNRRKCMRNQIFMTGLDLQEGVTVRLVEPITMYDKNGKPTGQRFIGRINGRRVQTVRRASWQVNGKTPYIWEAV